MLNALHRVLPAVEKKSHRVYLGIKPGSLSVYPEEGEVAVIEDEISCQFDGEEITIPLNLRYIEEPFKTINCDDICIRFTGTNKAITIVPVPETDFFHIVMPMQP
jgi:DNA polymerase-3 subunit beta